MQAFRIFIAPGGGGGLKYLKYISIATKLRMARQNTNNPMKYHRQSSKVCVALALFLASALSPSTLAFSPNQGVSKSSDVIGRSSPSHVQLQMSADPGSKKETTWDRITGPKLFKTVTNWNGIHSVPLVPLRIMTGLLMIHHGSEGE